MVRGDTDDGILAALMGFVEDGTHYNTAVGGSTDTSKRLQGACATLSDFALRFLFKVGCVSIFLYFLPPRYGSSAVNLEATSSLTQGVTLGSGILGNHRVMRQD